MNFLKTFLAAVLAFIVGSFLFFFISIFVLMGIVAAFSGGTTVTVKPESILKIDLSEQITDSPASDPFAGIDFMAMQAIPQLSLFKALSAIEAAKTDDRIKGIYLRLNGGGGAEAAAVEEIRSAIADFKESGKFVVSYNESYGQGAYYLASVADKIYIQPQGGIDWSGLSADMMFFKGLFDKLDLKMEVFRPTVCKYKSAVEPYILKKMSDENRRQMQELVNSVWGTIAGSVAQSRNIEIDRLNRITDKLEVTLPEEALNLGFVDGLLYEDQMKEVFAELGVETNSDDEYNFVSLREYASQLTPDIKKLAADRVAIVYADGAIVDGEGVGADVYGNTLAATLAKVRNDDKVKSVVVRVNSPGGSALASDVIWREMELLKEVKPVVVSMGSYAASGGYYISAPADVIVANKTTLTGSIGVFGMFLYTRDALENKLGITMDGVRSNESAGMGVKGPLTAIERAAHMRGVDKVYETFTNLVAEGRNLPVDRVLEIAGGRVWSGVDALGIGLIDTYGGLKTAIALAADKADLGDNFRVEEVLDKPEGFAAIFASLTASVRSSMLRSELGSMAKEYKKIKEVTSMQGIVMYSPYTLSLE